MISKIRMGTLPAAAIALLIAMLFLVGCGGSGDDEPEIEVSAVWSRPVTLMSGETDSSDPSSDEDEETGDEMENMNGATGVVYMTINNSSDISDTLLNASSDIANVLEFHESAMSDGVMQMRPVTRLEIPGDGTVTLEPGGYHIMLIGLTQALEVGETFDIELEFEESGTLTVTSEVRDDR